MSDEIISMFLSKILDTTPIDPELQRRDTNNWNYFIKILRKELGIEKLEQQVSSNKREININTDNHQSLCKLINNLSTKIENIEQQNLIQKIIEDDLKTISKDYKNMEAVMQQLIDSIATYYAKEDKAEIALDLRKILKRLKQLEAGKESKPINYEAENLERELQQTIQEIIDDLKSHYDCGELIEKWIKKKEKWEGKKGDDQ